jgi:8-oxo-dGTP pyrophosphatase MutT (NUDIX family)
MPVKKSAGVVIFRRAKNRIYYLLLHYSLGHWGFSKGNIEKGENISQTIRRETIEETGIRDIEFISGFKETTKYFYKLKGKNIFKIVIYLLAETKTEKVSLSSEHIDFKWLPYQEALKQLTFKSSKQALSQAHKIVLKQ